MTAQHALLTGATGYVGGRLLTPLLASGRQVRCLARDPARLLPRVPEEVEVVAGDCLDADSLGPAMAGIDTAYYLIHALGSGSTFEDEEAQCARNFATAASEAGVRRIVYLGGLGEQSHELSPHLRSRLATGEHLRSSTAEVIELRASIVLGPGSLSFDLLRALVERLPVLICPRWVRVEAQPIAIADVLAYLMATLDLPYQGSRTFEIGGPDRASYGDLMQVYAELRGLRRVLIPVPVLTPYLSSLWLGLVTPIFARIGRKLVESLRHPTVVTDRSAMNVFNIQPMGLRAAMERALSREDEELNATRWSDALSSAGPERSWGGVRFGSRLVDTHSIRVNLPPETAFTPIRRIGGQQGWYFATWLWHVRGFLDLLVGGVGMRRGRPDPETPRIGDTLDFWRVEAYEEDRLLRLAAEMKVPGRAWLQLEVAPDNGNGSTIVQTAMFDPVGLLGLGYWYALYPAHQIVFRGLLGGIAREARRLARTR
jgi:uncharacterized protein YbjT (DUF2867 family)